MPGTCRPNITDVNFTRESKDKTTDMRLTWDEAYRFYIKDQMKMVKVADVVTWTRNQSLDRKQCRCLNIYIYIERMPTTRRQRREHLDLNTPIVLCIGLLATETFPAWKVWEAWFRLPGGESIVKIAHGSRLTARARRQVLELGFRMVDEIETAWGDPSVWMAERHILEVAFAYPRVTHCLFVSQDTIPLQSPRHMMRMLETRYAESSVYQTLNAKCGRSYLDDVRKQGIRIVFHHQSMIVHRSGWQAIRGMLKTYFPVFARALTRERVQKALVDCAMDECFWATLLHHAKASLVPGKVVYCTFKHHRAEWKSRAFIREMLSQIQQYLVARKFREQDTDLILQVLWKGDCIGETPCYTA